MLTLALVLILAVALLWRRLSAIEQRSHRPADDLDRRVRALEQAERHRAQVAAETRH